MQSKITKILSLFLLIFLSACGSVPISGFLGAEERTSYSCFKTGKDAQSINQLYNKIERTHNPNDPPSEAADNVGPISDEDTNCMVHVNIVKF